jgi:hypothetical protein
MAFMSTVMFVVALNVISRYVRPYSVPVWPTLTKSTVEAVDVIEFH